MATTSDSWVHPFERAGLGKGPFSCVGYVLAVYQAVPGAPDCPIQPGSSCDFCGQGIMHVYRIQGSDGRTFNVGNQCVIRTAHDAAEETAWREILREERRAVENAARAEAWRLAKEERDQILARERARLAEKNYQMYAFEIAAAEIVADSPNCSEWEKRCAHWILSDLTQGKRNGISDKERRTLSIAYLATLLPESKHIGSAGSAGVRLRNMIARYEGGPIIGHPDSLYGCSVLCKFRIVEGPDAGAVLIWKTKYHAAPIGAIVSVTGTIDKERPHGEYQGIKQTKIGRCKVEVLDESGVIEVRDHR